MLGRGPSLCGENEGSVGVVALGLSAGNAD